MQIMPHSAQSIDRAVSLLEQGKLVALPTETVYGLAADATNGDAVAKIFATKGRPQFNPLIAHVANIEMAKDYVAINGLALELMQEFWPGPLTFVLPLKDDSTIHPLTTAGLPTLAIRSPDSIMRSVIQQFGRPLAAPSANRSGRISPTNAQAVVDDLGTRVDLVIDQGACRIGVESTIIRPDDNGDVYLLRPGGLAAEIIESRLGKKLLRLDQRAAIQAPGMLKSHYAPNASMRLNIVEVMPEEALLAFGPQRAKNWQQARVMLNLSESGDLHEAARNLFDYLKQLDQHSVQTIVVEPIPETGLGEAINDRLQRAAAPKQ